MKVYKRDGSTFYFIGFLLLLGIFFTMAFASLDQQTTASESQNNANQIIYHNPNYPETIANQLLNPGKLPLIALTSYELVNIFSEQT